MSYNEKRNFGEKKWVAPLVVVVIIIGLAIVFSGDIRNVIYPTHEASVPTG